MALATLADFTFKNVNQADQVSGDPATMKANLDSQAKAIRDYINSTLKTEIDNHEANTAYVADTGTANAIVVTVTGATYTAGSYLIIKVAATNTGATTINLNDLGVKSLKKITNAGIVDLSAGDIPAGAIIFCVYDGTQYIADVGLASHLADTANPHAVTAAQVRALKFADIINDFVVSGTVPATSTTLTTTIPNQIAYVLGQRVDKASEDHTFTASKDTYIDLSNTGYTYVEVANAAAAPAVTANSIRLFKVVTDASAITTVTDLRTLYIPLSKDIQFQGNWSAPNVSSFRAYQSAAQSVAAATYTKVAYDTEVFDSLGEYDNATYRFTAKNKGTYMVSAGLKWDVGVDADRVALTTSVNGGEYSRLFDSTMGAADVKCSAGSCIIKLNAGDYIEILAWTKNALSTVASSTESYVVMTKIG